MQLTKSLRLIDSTADVCLCFHICKIQFSHNVSHPEYSNLFLFRGEVFGMISFLLWKHSFSHILSLHILIRMIFMMVFPYF